jgi:hypothetical protein
MAATVSRVEPSVSGEQGVEYQHGPSVPVLQCGIEASGMLPA